MRNIRKILLTVAVVTALAAGGAQAARGPDDGAGPHHGDRHGCESGRKGRLAAALGLSDRQKEQIHAIREKYRPALLPLRKEAAAERRALRNLVMADPQDEGAIRAQAGKIAGTAADMAVQRARMFREVRAIMTPEQRQKLDALKSRWEERREGRPDRRGSGEEGTTP